ncbi:MAG: biopolymer transporter ExbD [Pirellulales bacterium]|nr:biopolymer transporter ExbD [Pirellulales bacterium]
MRLPTYRERGAVGFNMTPLIDVVFLLIIFFLVSTHLARQEVELGLTLPTATTGHESDVVRRIVVNVLPGGKMRMAGQSLDISQLEVVLAGEQDKDTEVHIRSDEVTRYRHVEPIMIACARSGIWNITFGVTNPQR